jgi:nitroreductase
MVDSTRRRHIMATLDFLLHRRSVPSRLLSAPGPDEATLQSLITAALHVPDHGKLEPFRLLRIEGDARLRLGEFLAALTQSRQPAAEPAVIDKERQRFASAPLVLAVIACITPGHKVPEQEQLLSAGCVCYNLLQGAQALGFGAQWLTAWAAYDREVAEYLGLTANERVIGFVHIGTAGGAAPERPRPVVQDKVQTWTPPR